MEPFDFTNTHTFTEEEYQDLHRVFSKKGKFCKKLIMGVLIIACFFSDYTLMLGIALALLLLFKLFIPAIARFGSDYTYRDSKYLKNELTYSICDQHLTLDGQDMHVQVGWPMVKVWQLHDRWLSISCDHIPCFYYDIEKLKKEDLLSAVLKLCEKHGVMFDSEEAEESITRSMESFPTQKKQRKVSTSQSTQCR
jgi:hypothetical protein